VDRKAVTPRPNIAVSGPDRGGTAAWWFTRLAVWRAGGRAKRFCPSGAGGFDGIQGLVIGGGADVDPGLYAQAELGQIKAIVEEERRRSRSLLRMLFYPAMYLLRKILSLEMMFGGDRDRDAFEFELIRTATTRQIPVLGICRGAQLINVYMGGSLFQDLSAFYMETPQINTVLPRKVALLEAGSRLAAIMGRHRIWINALHRQAVDQLGQDIRIAAREPNGVIQAIEHHRHPFLIGVQWHPEYLPHKPLQQRLFQALIAAARRPIQQTS
jgi:putative glutamine amidotransferase